MKKLQRVKVDGKSVYLLDMENKPPKGFVDSKATYNDKKLYFRR